MWRAPSQKNPLLYGWWGRFHRVGQNLEEFWVKKKIQMRRGVLHVWWGTGVRFKKKNMFEKKHHFTMLLGLWMLMVCSPVFLKNEPSTGIYWYYWFSKICRLFLKSWTVSIWSPRSSRGVSPGNFEESRTTGQKSLENPVFLCLGGGNSNMFFSFSPFKLVGTSRPRLSEIETWIKVEVPWGELNLNTLYEHIDLCVYIYMYIYYMYLHVVISVEDGKETIVFSTGFGCSWWYYLK